MDCVHEIVYKGLSVKTSSLLKCQRDPLDEQFDELFKDASEELREKIDMDLASDRGVSVSVDGDDDSDVLVVEYVSDDETLQSADKIKPEDDANDECDHVLKVNVIFTIQLQSLYYQIQFFESTRLSSSDKIAV